MLDESVVPSATPIETIAAVFDQDSLTKAERQKLAAKGQFPKRVEPAKPAESQPATSAVKAETEPDSEPGDDEETLSPAERKKRNRGLRAELVRANERAKVLEEQLAASRKSAPAAPKEEVKPAAASNDSLPDLDEYIEAGKTAKQWQIDYAKAVRAQAKKDAQELLSQQREQQQKESKESTLQGRIKDAKKEFKDFEDLVLNGDTPASDAMIAAMQSREDGMKIAYYLATHREESERLFKLSSAKSPKSEARIDIEFDAIAEKLANPPPEPRPKTLTNAPAPPRPAGGNGAATADPLEAAIKAKDWKKMNQIMDERSKQHARG